MKYACESQGCMEVHGADSASSVTWSMHVLGRDGSPCAHEQSRMAMHGEHMEAQPPMGLRVIQMRGACNHIRFQVRLRVRQGTTCVGMMKSTHGCKGCMEVHGGSKGTFSCRHARITDISPPPLPPPPPPPIPACGLEYRKAFANSNRQLAWPRVHCKI